MKYKIGDRLTGGGYDYIGEIEITIIDFNKTDYIILVNNSSKINVKEMYDIKSLDGTSYFKLIETQTLNIILTNCQDI